MTWTRLYSATLAAALVLGGCDAGGEAERAGSEAAAESAESAVGEVGETPRDSAPGPQSATLSSVNRSDVRGTAGVDRDGDDAVVRLDVEGLEPGQRYSAHVHEGRCATGGPIRLPLGRITADEGGSGGVRMRVAGNRLPDAGLFVQIHAPSGEPVACADVNGPGATP